MDRPLVSIVVPFRNEATALPALLHALAGLADEESRVRFEFVLVDDGSTDGGAGIVRIETGRDRRVRLIRLSRGFGKEAALTAGISAARGAAIIPMDADGQHPVSAVPAMLSSWLDGAPVVLARRANRHAEPRSRRVAASGFYWLFNKLSAVELPDDVGDFRLMDRQVIDAFLRFPERERFVKGLFAYIGFQPVFVEYEEPRRLQGRSRFSFWRLWNFALDGLFSFSTAPLRVWTYIGMSTALLTVLYAAFTVVQVLVNGIEVPGYASILIAVLMMGAVNLVGVGIVGEYLGRVYAETKQRPLYVIAEESPVDDQHA